MTTRAQATPLLPLRASVALATLVALSAFVPLGAALPGCGDSASAVHARQETIEAFTALRAYGADQREAFVQEVDARMALLDRQLDELKARSARSSGDAKQGIEDALAALQARRARLAEQLATLEQSSAEAWNTTRDATVDAFESLADGINEAATKFAR